jgi:hypothetical protein
VQIEYHSYETLVSNFGKQRKRDKDFSTVDLSGNVTFNYWRSDVSVNNICLYIKKKTSTVPGIVIL